MAQIKKIVKPGDLIRGASVGLAGLDKDGNVVGYKAAAADAGKVMTVGEDGSVTPAEGGGGSKKYMHNVFVNDKLQNTMVLSFLFVSTVDTPFTTLDAVCQHLVDNLAADSFIHASGGGRIVTASNAVYDMIPASLKITANKHVEVWGAEINTSSNSVSKTVLIGNIGVYTTNVIDTVTEL